MPPVTDKAVRAAAAAAPVPQQRYLVNRDTGDVWIWTERLREAYPAFEEVFAKDAETAKIKRAMPEPRTVSLAQLEEMSKADLLLFARVKMDPPVAVLDTMTKEVILDHVKEALFTRVAGDQPKG